MTNVSESLISLLECPVCVEFMVAPIFQCSNGHNVCGTCKTKVKTCPSCRGVFVTRNRALEQIIENSQFPCENVEFGCPATMLVSKRDQHGKVCSYRLYECLAGKKKGCKWTGRKPDILAHVQKEHKEVAWMKGDKLFVHVENLVLPKEVRDCQLLQAHGEIFWFYQHYSATDETLYNAVQYIGPAENAKNFTYKIGFGSVINSAKVSMTCFTCSDLEDSEKILKPHKCAYVEFWKLNKLIHSCKILFEIKIKKVTH